MQSHETDPCLVASFKFLARLSAGVVLFACLVMLVGPQLAVFRDEFQSITIIKPFSIAIFILASLSLWRSSQYKQDSSPLLARVIAFPALLLGSWNLLQSMNGLLLHRRLIQLKQFDFETRMGGSVYALAFLFLGLALILLPASSSRSVRLAQIAAIIPALVSILGICDHVLNPAISDFGVPVVSAVLFCLLAAGVLMARPNIGFAVPLSSDSVGGEMFRRLVPALAVLSITVSWIRYQGELNRWYTSETGVALSVAFHISIVTVIVWWMAYSMAKADSARKLAEEIATEETAMLRASNDQLAQQLHELGEEPVSR